VVPEAKVVNDFAALQRAFHAFGPLPEDQITNLVTGARTVRLQKGEWLLREGEAADWLGFLAEGLVRYFCRQQDREVNLGFELEGGFVGDYAAYMQRSRAMHCEQALEPSRVLWFPRELVDGLLAGHACWREISGRIAESELARKMQDDIARRTSTPEERYRALVAARSPLLQRVPLFHLASYLGVTPETLSRIRARRAKPADRDRS
jgi:CRP-like cAMP-binding protein